MIRRIAPACAGLLLAAGCANTPPSPAAPTEPVPRALERACRAEADRRFRQIPAVSSGRTLYLSTGDRERLYRECVGRRGPRR